MSEIKIISSSGNTLLRINAVEAAMCVKSRTIENWGNVKRFSIAQDGTYTLEAEDGYQESGIVMQRFWKIFTLQWVGGDAWAFQPQKTALSFDTAIRLAQSEHSQEQYYIQEVWAPSIQL